MGETLDFLIHARGKSAETGAFVAGAGFDRTGLLGFGLGDGNVLLCDRGAAETWRRIPAHKGAILALAPHPTGGFVTGGDDGALRHVAPDGTVGTLGTFGMKWVEQVTTHRAGGLIAAAVGKTVHLFDATGRKLRELVHPSSVTGLAFDARGKRLAGAHYNGASLWFTAAAGAAPRVLEWKGSHIGVALHPDAEALVTAMQENALHGWTLPEGKHLRMSGYPAKTRAMSFSRGGRWLATSGSDAMVIWPFFGGGPMGKAPLELAGGDGVLCAAVAFHPREEVVAGGFADGLAVLAEVSSSRIVPLAPPGLGAVSALAWSDDGGFLALGTEGGLVAVLDLTKRPAG